MKFQELNETIPFAKYGKEKSLSMSPYPNITLLMPGRHAKESAGGDFCVCVTDAGMKWKKHQFTHTDIFKDVELKKDDENISFFMGRYLDVIVLSDPNKIALGDGLTMPGIDFDIFLRAVQCLAVAEFRRYHQHETKFGGRYLPFRAAAGIAEGLWTAADATEKTRKMGRPGIEWLEQEFGVPELTKELMDG